jgi:hypothetical protein
MEAMYRQSQNLATHQNLTHTQRLDNTMQKAHPPTHPSSISIIDTKDQPHSHLTDRREKRDQLGEKCRLTHPISPTQGRVGKDRQHLPQTNYPPKQQQKESERKRHIPVTTAIEFTEPQNTKNTHMQTAHAKGYPSRRQATSPE